MLKMFRSCCVACGMALLLSACAGKMGLPGSTESQANTVETGTIVGDSGDPRNRARVHTELASLYFERGSMGVALEELRVALEAEPNYAPAYNLLGLVHMDLRENNVAQQHFERALRIAPNDPDVNNNYGWFLCQSGREDESIRYFLAALKNPLYAAPARSYVNAGVCAMRKNNDRDAFEYFERALKIAPDNRQALLSLGDLQYKRGAFETARDLIGRFNKAGDPTAESLWLATRIERKLGDKAAETAFGTQLRRRFTTSKEYQDLLKGKYE
jgi:type IV pilus assembly protein PilF